MPAVPSLRANAAAAVPSSGAQPDAAALPTPLVFAFDPSHPADDRREWLLTNGLGGFAMGTLASVPTRRYHGLLIAATRPPVGRVALLNATVDSAEYTQADGSTCFADLSSFRFAGLPGAVHPGGASRLVEFRRDNEIRWISELPGLRVTKSLSMPRAMLGTTDLCANRVALRWSIDRTPTAAGAHPLRLLVRPLVSLRNFHGLIRRHWADRFCVTPGPTDCRVDRDGLGLTLSGAASAPLRCSFRHDAQWWNDLVYAEDAARGQDCIEDLYSPGVFTLEVPADMTQAQLTLTAALPTPSMGMAAKSDRAMQPVARTVDLISHVRHSHPSATVESGWSERLAALVRASEDFVVSRAPAREGEAGGASIIAGYPWFSDWGRDTLISLPGLLLTTGRFEEARAVLQTFAEHRRRGIIPNVFNDQTGEPEYNTVDASLWFLHAACQFLNATGDRAFWLRHLSPACADVIAHYRRGTDFNIAMDPFDKLITAGTNATQLTWMDARRDGVVFTPRHGKPVEICALWHSGLAQYSKAIAAEDPAQSANLNDLAETVARSFRGMFWSDRLGCCVDCLAPGDDGRSWRPVEEVRPNQIFAVSLPHSPLSLDQQKSVIDIVTRRLLTPRGVRTLDPADPRYRPRYEGNLFERDGAYHQGTAWPWLLGPLAEAVLRAGSFSKSAKARALELLRPLCDELVSPRTEPGACVGQIAEIYDAAEPQRPQGCPAQAWSVAEILRVAVLAQG